ncbi:MAG: DUF2304 domain-containing protein [Solobacterium sp.]|nr:DUF2304 domain-containing protein [Erysipelotrichaceae bacterium]MBQ9152515.1 DUF2304 domain-containing protein [Solobacterium sp.]
MTPAFRILLILAAVLSFMFMISNIRRSRLRISDSIFWFLFAALLILLAVFPQIAYFFGGLLGIISTVNLVFLVIIALLLFRVFTLTLRVSELDGKIEELAQTIALKNMKDNEKE